MNRIWLGIGVLILLLVLGVGVTLAMQTVHAPISKMLEQAGQAALEEDWEKALSLAQQGKQRWKKWRRLTASVGDHGPMEEIEALFAELEIYAAAREQPHFSAICARLSCLLAAMADAHNPSWWNLI